MARRPPTLGDEVARTSNWESSGLVTPTNSLRPDLCYSMQTGTAAFHGSAANTPKVATLHTAMHIQRPQTAPLTGATPTHRRAVPVAQLGTDAVQTAAAVELSGLATPTNSSRRLMFARGSRSIRNTVLANTNDAEETVPRPQSAQPLMLSSGSGAIAAPVTVPTSGTTVTTTVTSPPMRVPRNSVGALGPDVVRTMTNWEPGVLATPTNMDRRDMQSSLRMGTPTFRGSSAMPLASELLKNPMKEPGMVSMAPAGRMECSTPGGSVPRGKCFVRT